MRLILTQTLPMSLDMHCSVYNRSVFRIETFVNLSSPLFGTHYVENPIFFTVKLLSNCDLYWYLLKSLLYEYVACAKLQAKIENEPYLNSTHNGELQNGGRHLYDFFQSHGMRILV